MAYQPSPAEIEGAPKVTLGGRDFAVLPLPPRLQRIVIPAIFALLPRLGAVMAAVQNPAANLNAMVALEFTPADYDNISDAVYWAVTRAEPTLSRDDFMDLPIGTGELLAALPVVMRQAGMMVPEKKATGGNAAGEAAAGGPRTGTP